jgi:hypothetical protein
MGAPVLLEPVIGAIARAMIATMGVAALHESSVAHYINKYSKLSELIKALGLDVPASVAYIIDLQPLEDFTKWVMQKIVELTKDRSPQPVSVLPNKPNTWDIQNSSPSNNTDNISNTDSRSDSNDSPTPLITGTVPDLNQGQNWYWHNLCLTGWESPWQLSGTRSNDPANTSQFITSVFIPNSQINEWNYNIEELMDNLNVRRVFTLNALNTNPLPAFPGVGQVLVFTPNFGIMHFTSNESIWITDNSP